tara:strand:- start:3837 stop:4589 length:753 start_codon:yes stop_codon:yes gene_type:complete
MIKLGIIGGSGLDNPNFFKGKKDHEIETPYGKTSSKLKQGLIDNVDVIILSRHGRKHSLSPTNVNYRANIWALKELGCTNIIATTAVGSLRTDIAPGHIVLPNQFIDFTKKRQMTFFDESSNVVHTEMANPFCKEMISHCSNVMEKLDIKFHINKTVITIEGPRFSSKAESHMFRSWGADIINMSSCPEVILANELGIKYMAIAMSTDYDCWKEDEDSVTWEMIQKIMSENSSKVIEIIKTLTPKLVDIN